MSYKCGLKYIVAIVAEFDEYSNDVLHLHEGSWLPRYIFLAIGVKNYLFYGCLM